MNGRVASGAATVLLKPCMSWRPVCTYSSPASGRPALISGTSCALSPEKLPSLRTPLAELEMMALDLETTGLDMNRDHIITAGWVLVRGERIVMASAHEVRVRNGGADGVRQGAVIYGITDRDLDDAD